MNSNQYVPMEDAAARTPTGAKKAPSTESMSGTTTTGMPDSPRSADETRAATRAATCIQASFRGFKARSHVADLKLPHLFPATGPLANQGILPPTRTRRNPICASVTSGENGSWGCPGPTNRNTIHFDERYFPPALEGIYSHDQWQSLMTKLNAILHSTHLPLCPGAFLWLVPILGACYWFHWQESLRARRLEDVHTCMDGESARLGQFGLKWITTVVYAGPREGRGEIDGLVIELVMPHRAPHNGRDTMAAIKAHAPPPPSKSKAKGALPGAITPKQPQSQQKRGDNVIHIVPRT